MKMKRYISDEFAECYLVRRRMLKTVELVISDLITNQIRIHYRMSRSDLAVLLKVGRCRLLERVVRVGP